MGDKGNKESDAGDAGDVEDAEGAGNAEGAGDTEGAGDAGDAGDKGRRMLWETSKRREMRVRRRYLTQKRRCRQEVDETRD